MPPDAAQLEAGSNLRRAHHPEPLAPVIPPLLLPDEPLNRLLATPDAIEALLIAEAVKAIPSKSREIALDFDAADDPLHGGQEGVYCRRYCYQLTLLLLRGHPALRPRRDHELIRRARSLQLLRPAHQRPPQTDHRAKARVAAQRPCGRGGGATRTPVHRVRLPHPGQLGAEAASGRQDRAAGEGCQPALRGHQPPRRGVGDPADAPDRYHAARLYEDFYCALGDMDCPTIEAKPDRRAERQNRIKNQQIDLFADHTSTHQMASNQLRLWLDAFAHLIIQRLKARVLKGTVLERANIGTIRLKLFKIAARIKVSLRRVLFECCSSYPLKEFFATVHGRLANLTC